MFDTDEINANIDPVLQFFMDAMAWGHIDEIPQRILQQTAFDMNISARCLLVVVAGLKSGNIEDPMRVSECHATIDLTQHQNEFNRFRAWICLEFARRKGVIKFDKDILIREMPTHDIPSSMETMLRIAGQCVGRTNQ